MPELRLITFGGLRALWDGQDVTASLPAKSLALMVYLARQHKPQSREHLAELFWPERTTEQAYGSLRTALSKTRALIGDALQIDYQSVGVTAWLDANHFEVLAQEDDQLQAALSLYQGAFMASFSSRDARDFEHWMLREAEHLHERFIQAGLRHIHQLHTQHKHNDAVMVGRGILTYAPLREDVHRLLMRLYHEMGEAACALQQYETCRRLLWEELGVEPDASTQAVLLELKTAPTQVLSSMNAIRQRLPTRITNFVGRADVLDTVENILLDCRLLIISATGGAGKTRLSLELAYRLKDQFKDGVCFVDLTQTTHAGDVLATIAQTLGLSTPQPLEVFATLQRSLQGREMLLILDNFEHVIEAADEIAHLLSEAPDVKFLITSREPLKLYGERIYKLNPLTLAEASQLFRERVRDVDPYFRRTTQSDALIESICEQLDGMPLAVELAANRARTMGLDEILKGLSSRLDLLQSDFRNKSRRQRTMFYTIDWSYQLLTPQQASLLRNLAVFHGGWTAHALKQISPHAAQLADLVDKNLVWRSPFGFQRYALQEPVREYALLKLEAEVESAPLRLAHARWVVAFTEQCAEELRTPRHPNALAGIWDEQENIRAALDFLAHQPDYLELYARIISAASWILTVQQSPMSLMPYARHAVTQADKLPVALKAQVLCAAGHCADWVGEYHIADVWQSEGQRIFEGLGDTINAAYARFYLSARTVYDGNFFTELNALRVYAFDVGDEFLICLLDTNLGVSMLRAGHWANCQAILKEGIAIAERNNFTILLAAIYINLGDAYINADQFSDVFLVLERAITLSRTQGNRYLEAFCLFGFCELAYITDQSTEFEHYVREVEALVMDSGNPFMWALIYFWQSAMALNHGDYGKADDYIRLCLKEVKPDNGNMQTLITTLLIFIAYRLSCDYRMDAAGQLLGGLQRYVTEVQISLNRLQRLLYNQTLAVLGNTPHITGEGMGIQDLLQFAHTLIVRPNLSTSPNAV